MSLAAIRDQEVATRLLGRLLQNRRTPNAMLFWGPSGVGKQTTALEFAKAVNCPESEADACDACLTCRRIANGNHPDVKAVAPSDKSREIKKSAVDEINELASLRPYESAWRIFLIQEADRMNAAAQNHFLKTLEEPPGQSLFVLISQSPRVLLPTIRSRCQAVRFRALMPETVADLLQSLRDLPADLAGSIASVAEGQMTRALDLVDSDRRDIVFAVLDRLADGEDPVALAEEFSKALSDRRKQIEAAVKADLSAADDLEITRENAEQLKKQQMARVDAEIRRDILEYLYLMQTWYRDELIYGAVGSVDQVWNRDRQARLEAKCSSDPGSKIAAIENARTYLDRYIPEDRVFRDLFFTLSEP